MSKVVLIAARGPDERVSALRLRQVCARLNPEHLDPIEPLLVSLPRCHAAVTRPGPSIRVEQGAICCGKLAEPAPDWAQLGAPAPDGTYALFRASDDAVELVSDFIGSRTIWYSRTDRFFIASTSQRAIVCLLGELRLNRLALSWMLSSGMLGPEASWDERIQRLPGNARLTLDIRTWRTSLVHTQVVFEPGVAAGKSLRAQFADTITSAVRRYNFGEGAWWLPLSGGYDSRALLVLLQESVRPTCVTWGLARSLEQPGSDGFVARQLAEHFKLRHECFLTDMSSESPDVLVDRFLAAGEGCSDQLPPYLDGFSLWRRMCQAGVIGIIRGDEGFGWVPVNTEVLARTCVGMGTLADYFGDENAGSFGLPEQVLPEPLRRQRDESVAVYRDRLYHAYRIPVFLAALNDLKLPYVEIVSPLLSRSILELVRRMPDNLRTAKSMFARMVEEMSPAIPFATISPDDAHDDFLRSPPFVQLLKDELQSDTAADLFSHQLGATLLSSVSREAGSDPPSHGLRFALKRVAPASWLRTARAWMGPQPPNPRRLAFRAMLASRMVRLLRADANLLS